MNLLRIHHLPAIIASTYLITDITTYLIATTRKDANALFPYISETGTYPPESCIFAQMYNILAILLAVLIFIRYRQVDDIWEYYHLENNIKSANKISVIIGYLSASGYSIAGNFQVTNAAIVHVIGATLALGFMSLWMCYQTWISYKILPLSGSLKNNQYRLFLTIVCAIAYNVMSFYGYLAYLKFKGDDKPKWKKEDGGYNYHLTSCIIEWIFAITTNLYFLSFTSELKCVSFDGICVTIHKIYPTKNITKSAKLATKPQHRERNTTSVADQQEFHI